MTTPRQKSVPGHKRAKVLFGVTVVCECGQSFGPWYGKGARTQAHSEWKWHLDQCRTQLSPAPSENRS